MLEAVILLTAAGICIVEFIEWQQKRRQCSDATPHPAATDWIMSFRADGERRHVVIVEGTR